METNNLQKVVLYSDGAAKGNPGPGGYGVHLEFYNTSNKVYKVKEYAQAYPNTTNNKMELLGVIIGMENITTPSKVHVYTDSNYVVKAFNDKWIDSWIEHKWTGSNGKPVKNIEYWKRLLSAIKPHLVIWHWVKGHNGNELNERADFLASRSADGYLFEPDKNGKLVEKSFTMKDVEEIKKTEEKLSAFFMNMPEE